MPDAARGAALLALAGSLVMLWKEVRAGDNLCLNHLTARRQLILDQRFSTDADHTHDDVVNAASAESTLAIRARLTGRRMPDGFSVLHHLDANGIL